ncbi:hypothetical protein JXR93_05445 [bacterium]|nr:hypothetical protein [bacterium]
MGKFIFLIILTLLISCGSRKNLKYTIEPTLREKTYPIVIFPAKLLYPHGGFDIFKNTLMFQDGFGAVNIPFYIIETTSIDNFFNNSNLYTLLKSKNIDFKSVLIIQPTIKITEESTSIQIEDKKGNVTESANKKQHIEIIIDGYIGDSQKNSYFYKDRFLITAFQIDLEQDDPTYYLSEKLRKIGSESAKLLNPPQKNRVTDEKIDSTQKNIKDIDPLKYSADKTGAGFDSSINSSQKDLEIFFLKKYIHNR